MGEALEAYLNGETKAAITVISDITEDDVIPVSYLFRNFNEMPEIEQIALKKCNGNVLDIGAGAGSHALYLQQKGLHVTALDISLKAVLVMKKRGVENAIAADFWQFQSAEKFDTILLLMNGIGLAGKLEKLPEFFSHLKNLLNPSGKILLESSDLLYMFEEEDGSVVLDLNGTYYGEVQYQMAFQGKKGFPFPWLFVDFPLLADAAAEAGFQAEMLYEGENSEYLAELTLL